jgi:DNA-binding response OmpR family regulator
MSTTRPTSWLQRVARLLGGAPRYPVLIVDSRFDEARHLASVLGEGFHVRIVGGLHAAFQAVVDQPPILVVTELELSDGSGIDLVRALRNHPSMHRALLMVVSWRKGIDDKVAAFEAGADNFLVKPVSPSAFLEEVKRLSYFRQILLPSG